jgi:hypothetical protein
MSSAFRLSLGLNIALLGIVAVLLWHDRSLVSRDREVAVGPAFTRPATAKSPVVAEGLAPKISEPKITPAAIAQLERLGIPRDTLVNALLESFNRRSTQQVVALQKKYAPKLVPEREMIELSRQCDIEQTRELKEALGEEGYRAWDKEQTLHALNRARVPGDELPMTADEAEQAYRLQKDFDQKAKELQLAMEDGVADKADAGTLQAQAQQALDRDLEKLLGKERFSELRSNTPPTTEVYRTFGDLNPSPDQANAVIRADGDYHACQAALTKRLTENPAETANVMAELQALADAREQTYRQLFGADAYDNFKLTHDATYQTLKQYADAWNLNADEVKQVYQSVNTFQQQADRMRAAASLRQEAGQSVDWKEVNASIEQAQQQTETVLQSAIGPERLRRLKQNGLLENGGPSG